MTCKHSGAFMFDWIFFILAGNKDYKVSNEFEIRPDPTIFSHYHKFRQPILNVYTITIKKNMNG